MPAGTRKGGLTGARGSLGQILILSTFHRHEPRWCALLQLRWCQVRTEWNKRSKAALLCVTAQSWEDSAGPSPAPSPRVSEQIFYIRKDGLLDLCSLTALLPWALQPKWTQSQGHQQLGFWNMLTFNGQQIPHRPTNQGVLGGGHGGGLEWGEPVSTAVTERTQACFSPYTIGPRSCLSQLLFMGP